MTQPDDVTSLDAATRDAHAEIARLHEEALTNIGEQSGGEEDAGAGDPGWFGDEGQQTAPDRDPDGSDQEHGGQASAPQEGPRHEGRHEGPRHEGPRQAGSRRAGRAWPDDDGDR